MSTLVGRAERYCIHHHATVRGMDEEIDRCTEYLMFTFWGLYRHDIRGIDFGDSLDRDECIDAYRASVRDEDRIGYWLLGTDCSEPSFNETRHIAWQVRTILDDYWASENVGAFHPPADSIPRIDFLDDPFFIFTKDLEAFHGGASRRIKEDPRFRERR